MNRKILMLIMGAAFLTATTAHAQSNLSGSYVGKLDVGMAKLTIVLNIDAGGKATMESPDQTDQKIPATVDFLSADSVAVSIAMLQASYEGRLVADELRGTFAQAGFKFPLNLKAGKLERRRTQTIVGPLPYPTEEVTFCNEQDGATLAGTLSVPTGAENVLIMVTGSGQQNRDEELMGHKPFAVIADYLARHGIATLRYDDRATGQSIGGDVANATSEDFARDAAAGIAFLRKDGRFKKVGVLGHSEGGLIAFMLGSKGFVDFIVSLAGPGVSGDTVLWKQIQISQATPAGEELSMEKVRETILAQNNPWLNYFLNYDPSENIRHTTCPVLALNGTKDIQVDAEINLSALRRLLPKNKKNSIKAYDGLNHLFQHCTTGMPDEYGNIEETFSEEVMKDMVEWLKKL